jgi:hypothetical protein
MILADAWYASGTFWAIAGVAVALVFGVAAVWVTWWVGNPRRRLVYGMPSVTRLLNDSDGIAGSLEVRRDGKVLTDPYVVTLQLANRGRFDIPRSLSDAGTPLRLDVGTPIVEVLKVASSPTEFKRPAVVAGDSWVDLGPSLISRGQTVEIVLLADGPAPVLTCPERPLIDVEMRELSDDDFRTPLTKAAGLVGEVAVVSVPLVGPLIPLVRTLRRRRSKRCWTTRCQGWPHPAQLLDVSVETRVGNTP